MTGDLDPHSEQLDQIIAAYLQAVEAGDAPSREQLLDEHPELAEQLNEFFTQHEAMQRAATDAPDVHRDDITVPPVQQPPDEATLAPDAPDALEVGTRVRYFGDYELLEEIARGGMGVVYKARQASLNRIVALKMILAGQLADEEDVQRFHAEAEAAANLDHPGIVPIHELGVHDGQHYFSMGYVEGSSLAERIADGPLPPREAAELTKKVAEAVAYAHEHGVIHRDLKPANVLIDQNDQPRVTDFGLAKRIEGDSDLTRSGQILGTPSYMSPEQASGRTEDIKEVADVYALGAILYALLTGRPPFQADNQLDTLLQVQEQEPVSPQNLNSKIPKDLETICLKCLEKNQQRRYSSAQTLFEELGRFLNGEPILGRPISGPARAWRWCQRKPAIASLWVLLLTLGVGGPIVAIQQAELRVQAEDAYIERLRVEFEARGWEVQLGHQPPSLFGSLFGIRRSNYISYLDLNPEASKNSLHFIRQRVGDADFECLRKTPKLEELSLRSCSVTNTRLEQLEQMSNLRYLFLSNTYVTDAGLVHLKCLKRLETLELNFTLVTDVGLEHLKGLTNLKNLVLDYTMVTEKGLSNFRKARPDIWIHFIVQPTPNASEARAVAEIRHMGGFVVIDENIPERPVVAVFLPDHGNFGLGCLGELSSLHALHLCKNEDMTNYTLKQLAGLAKLQTLCLYQTQIRDAGLPHLEGLTNLKSLDLRGTRVSHEGIMRLQQALPNCKISR